MKDYTIKDKEIMKEIEEIINKYYDDGDELARRLQKYERPDGSLPLPVRWLLDSFNYKRRYKP